MRILNFLSSIFRPGTMPSDLRPTAELNQLYLEKIAELQRKVQHEELHQRVVDELRREYYAIGGLGMPGHLSILKDSGFPLHCDIYEREIARWQSDAEWCADTFGVDRWEFIRTCQNVDELRDERGLLPPRGR